MIYPRKPALNADTLADLERRGVPAVSAILSHLAKDDAPGLFKPEQQAAYVLRVTDFKTVSVTRREVEIWLAWKADRADLWIKIGVIAAILAAVLAFLGCFLTLAAWRDPISPPT